MLRFMVVTLLAVCGLRFIEVAQAGAWLRWHTVITRILGPVSAADVRLEGNTLIVLADGQPCPSTEVHVTTTQPPAYAGLTAAGETALAGLKPISAVLLMLGAVGLLWQWLILLLADWRRALLAVPLFFGLLWLVGAGLNALPPLEPALPILVYPPNESELCQGSINLLRTQAGFAPLGVGLIVSSLAANGAAAWALVTVRRQTP